MARNVTFNLVVAGGSVTSFDSFPLADDDLPRPSPGAAGGHNADYLVVDQYGRVVAWGASTAAYTDAANVFTQTQRITTGILILGAADVTGVAVLNSGGNCEVRHGTLSGYASLFMASMFGVNASGNVPISFDPQSQYLAMSSGFLFGWTSGTDYNSTLDLGLIRDSAGVLRLTQGGTVISHSANSGSFVSGFTDTTTNTAGVALTTRRNLSSGTAAAGLGATHAFQIDSSTTKDRDAAALSAAWLSATDATRAAKLTATVYYTTTAREAWRAEASSSGLTLYLAGSNVSVADDGSASFAGGTVLVSAGGAFQCDSVQQGAGVWSIDSAGEGTFAAGAVVLRASGTVKPAHLADASAENDSVYFSTTAGKLAYKDAGGVVNNLY